jgi:uncharacterized protein YdcH (DUF465 family)
MMPTREPSIESLRDEHRQLEARIAELEHHLSLSPDEQRERVTLKKRKLVVKDRLLQLGRKR